MEKKSLHKISWTVACMSKARGGAGIGDMEITNRSLLLKWYWKLRSEVQCLWKDFTRGVLSPVWKGILSVINGNEDPNSIVREQFR